MRRGVPRSCVRPMLALGEVCSQVVEAYAADPLPVGGIIEPDVAAPPAHEPLGDRLPVNLTSAKGPVFKRAPACPRRRAAARA